MWSLIQSHVAVVSGLQDELSNVKPHLSSGVFLFLAHCNSDAQFDSFLGGNEPHFKVFLNFPSQSCLG